jgi:RimJ/RimL family protein N-acetyltransferase
VFAATPREELPVLLKTRRLALREVAETDLAAIHAYESDPAAVRYTLHGVRTLEEIRDDVRRSVAACHEEPRLLFDLAMTLAGDNRLIGRCGFRRSLPDPRVADLWFMANPRWWGQGYVTEAMTELIRYGFSDLGLHRFQGDCDPRNAASARVMEKLGMVREGHLRENVFAQGEWCDSWVYGILRPELSAASVTGGGSPG